MIRLVLVDDQAAVRQVLRMRLLLEPDITVIGEASNGKEAQELLTQHSFFVRGRDQAPYQPISSLCSFPC